MPKILVCFAIIFPAVVSNAAPDAFIPPKFKGVILSTPVPEYPPGTLYEPGQSAIYRLKINPNTGAVDEVGVMRRAYTPKLNAEAVLGLLKWKFKPGAIKEIDVPVEFDRQYIRPELKNAVVRQ